MMMEDKCANMAKECLGCAHRTQEYHEYPCSECEHNGEEYKMYFPAAEMNAILAQEDKPKIKDSGERRVFETGAVRDITEDKGRCDLMPLDVMAEHMEDSILLFIYQFTTNGNPGHLYRVLDEAPGRLRLGDRHNMYLEVAKHFEEGAKKYGENNWQKGLPLNCYIDSAVRHYLKCLRGDKDEPHDRAFCWNIMCAIWTCRHKPELNDYAKKEESND
jgi:hypothetical protein